MQVCLEIEILACIVYAQNVWEKRCQMPFSWKCVSRHACMHAFTVLLPEPGAAQYTEITAVGLGHSLIAFTFWSLTRRVSPEVSDYYIFQMHSAQPVIFCCSWGENCQIIHCTVIINAC